MQPLAQRLKPNFTFSRWWLLFFTAFTENKRPERQLVQIYRRTERKRQKINATDQFRADGGFSWPLSLNFLAVLKGFWQTFCGARTFSSPATVLQKKKKKTLRQLAFIPEMKVGHPQVERPSASWGNGSERLFIDSSLWKFTYWLSASFLLLCRRDSAHFRLLFFVTAEFFFSASSPRLKVTQSFRRAGQSTNWDK